MGRGRPAAPHFPPMNWNLFVTELVAGITHGAVYALIALGYSMVYGILKLLNFAHGDVYMVGSFIGFGIITVFVVAGTVVLMVGLTLFVRNTQLGKAMRATSFDREAAAMMGIDVDRVIVATFFIGSALAGAAGVFNGLAYQQVWPYMGFVAGLYAFTAAVVGGIGNLPGSVLGGLVIGLAEA